MKRSLLFLTIALILPCFRPAFSQELPKPEPLALVEPLQDKIFYFLSTLQRSAPVRAALENDPELKKIQQVKWAALASGMALNSPDKSATFFSSFAWSPQEIDTVSATLGRIFESTPALRRLVEKDLRFSGVMEQFSGSSDKELLRMAWTRAAVGMNHIFDTFGRGVAPRYAKIDSLAYDARSGFYRDVLSIIATVLRDDPARMKLFFEPDLFYALELLRANSRDEAARFEPLERGENKAAFERMRSVAWRKYPYAAILSFGIGPEDHGVNLSPAGHAILPAVAKRFREGKAPFILISGGFVHPAQTPYCEALEMKKALMSQFGIPESAIIIDPHARHTTTNFRNATRLLYRYGAPLSQKVLVTSNIQQIPYIDNAGFLGRCRDELGYEPFAIVGRPSPLDLECQLKLDSLQVDPMDPLDP